MKLTWNIVTKNIHPHAQLQAKIREKIVKLERHLQHFPPDAVHLQIALSRQPRRGQFTASLTLRVPSNILHAEKSAVDPIPALDRAVKALLRELSALKSELRRESLWKRLDRRRSKSTLPLVSFEEMPMPQGEGPQTFADAVSALLQRYYPQLEAYVERQVAKAVERGELPDGALDPRSVVADLSRQVLSRPDRRPQDVSYLIWFYLVAKQELRRRLREFRLQERSEIHCEQPQTLSLAYERSEGYDVERPRELVEQQFDPAVTEAGELFEDAHGHSPDEELSHKDFIDYLHTTASSWPTLDRDIFELHFLEGFEPDEVALLEKKSLREIREGILSVQARIRGLVASAALVGRART